MQKEKLHVPIFPVFLAWGLVNCATAITPLDGSTTEGRAVVALQRIIAESPRDADSTKTTRLGITPEKVSEWQSSAGVHVNEEFSSPDGRFSVAIVTKGQHSAYAIKDRANGMANDSIVVPTIVYRLLWTCDSRAIIAVVQMAEGSFVQRLHFDGNRWQENQYDPPNSEQLEHWEVLNISVEDSLINITWGISRIVHNSDRQERRLYLLMSQIDATGNQNVMYEYPTNADTHGQLKRKFYNE